MIETLDLSVLTVLEGQRPEWKNFCLARLAWPNKPWFHLSSHCSTLCLLFLIKLQPQLFANKFYTRSVVRLSVFWRLSFLLYDFFFFFFFTKLQQFRRVRILIRNHCNGDHNFYNSNLPNVENHRESKVAVRKIENNGVKC